MLHKGQRWLAHPPYISLAITKSHQRWHPKISQAKRDVLDWQEAFMAAWSHSQASVWIEVNDRVVLVKTEVGLRPPVTHTSQSSPYFIPHSETWTLFRGHNLDFYLVWSPSAFTVLFYIHVLILRTFLSCVLVISVGWLSWLFFMHDKLNLCGCILIFLLSVLGCVSFQYVPGCLSSISLLVAIWEFAPIFCQWWWISSFYWLSCTMIPNLGVGIPKGVPKNSEESLT